MRAANIVIIAMVIVSFAPVEATWTDIHQISSSSHTIQITGDGFSEDHEYAYDGISQQDGGDPVRLWTYPCYTQSTPSKGSSIEVDYTLSTNQSSVPFNIEFKLIHVPNNAPDSYASVSVYNMNTQSYDEIANISIMSGNDYNISRSSAYMDNAGNIYLKVFTGHGNQDCNSHAEVTFYEFFIYTDIVDEPNFDQDNDGISDSSDSCPYGESSWLSNPTTDYDGDGCRDDSEDLDDDNDGIEDYNDTCERGNLFSSNEISDHDSDGCQDNLEDIDNDNDGVNNTDDECEKGLFFTSTPITDYDSDGCKDESPEDLDDDNDGVNDIHDAFPYDDSESRDYDNDSVGDNADNDDDSDGIDDLVDDCEQGKRNWTSGPLTDHDSDGCKDDNPEDDNDDNDSHNDEQDNCPRGEIDWISSQQNDYDDDGCEDSLEDFDDDDDQICDTNSTDGICEISSTLKDECTSSALTFSSTNISDNDKDGCQDSSVQDLDDDNDGYLDFDDKFPLDDCAYLDTDDDGEPDTLSHDCDTGLIVDIDDDNDGVDDDYDAFPKHNCAYSDIDADGDPDELYGVCNELNEDKDDDNDGHLDVYDDFPLDNCAHLDTDMDGLPDEIDGICPGLTEDSDDDNDEVNDTDDAFPKYDCAYSDNDGDGQPDDLYGVCEQLIEDKDDDNDGHLDVNDDCPKEFGNGTSQGQVGCLVDRFQQEQTIIIIENKSDNSFLDIDREVITKVVMPGFVLLALFYLIVFLASLPNLQPENEISDSDRIRELIAKQEQIMESTKSELLYERKDMSEFVNLVTFGEKLVATNKHPTLYLM